MFVGVDIGTQSLKVVILDESLQVLGQSARGYDIEYPRPGWAQQDPELWVRALGPAIADTLKKSGIKSNDIKGLGISGQLDGCLAVDDAGRPVSTCLIWMDRRAEGQLSDIQAEEVQRRTGVILDAGHMAAKIRWLRDHPPDTGRMAMFHQPVSYMVSRLTGARVFDHGLASTTMLYSLVDKSYDPYLLDVFGIEADLLPAVAEATDRAGALHGAGAALTGLPQGLPVAVGTGDDFTNIIGTGETGPGRLICTIGTAEVVGALHHTPEIDPDRLVETHSFTGGRYFIENPGWFSGGAVAWLTGLLGMRNFQVMNDLAADVPAGAEGLLFLPALNGAMSPEWIPSARGCFYGLTPAHGAGHLARAVLEGCAFAMRDVAERLTAMGVPLDSLMLIGGGARSRLWGQIRSDISGLPAIVPQHVDTSAIGAALLASVASGRYPDLASCSEKIGAIDTTLEPEPANREPYNAAYAGYRLLFDSLRPLYKT